MRSARGLAVVLVASWLGTPVATGQVQSPTGNLYGTALDSQEKAVPGVTVTLTGPGAAQTADSDATGDFHFLELSPGPYSLGSSGRGSRRRAGRDVVLPDVVLSIIMPVAGATEAVTSSATRDRDGPRQSRGRDGRDVRQEELETFPRHGIPGPSPAGARSSGRQHECGKGQPTGSPPSSARVRNPDQNRYNLDGVAISQGGVSPIFFDFDSFERIEVTTGGSDLSLATAGRERQPRDAARHEPASGLGARLLHRRCRVGRMGSRPAARSGKTSSGSGARIRAQRLSGHDRG